MTYYHNGGGTLEDSFRDEGRHHLVIGMKRAMRRGEALTFDVEREAMVEFTKDEEWLETSIDHPVQHMVQTIVFPVERPCLRATFETEGRKITLPIRKTREGKTSVRFETPKARAMTPYTVRWLW
ncbi:MAG: hypothetical protein EPO21_01570 [Chloroflexota bacterium]|nr:MAG: hypothetical protein EPO21_01570 [Chloroflexota bacterium]